MALRKVKHSMVRYRDGNDITRLAFRGAVIDLPALEVTRLEALGAVVAADALTDVPVPVVADVPSSAPVAVQRGGLEIDYVYKDNSGGYETTTNTNPAVSNTLANKIAGLSLTIDAGDEDRKIQVDFVGYAVHSVADGCVGVHVLEDGIAVGIDSKVTRTASRPVGLHAWARRIIPAGESRTYEVGKFIFGAGTGTYDYTIPAFLTATDR